MFEGRNAKGEVADVSLVSFLVTEETEKLREAERQILLVGRTRPERYEREVLSVLATLRERWVSMLVIVTVALR